MTERSEKFMEKIWESRNNGADTEEKLVSSVVKEIPNFVRYYNAQNGTVVLDLNDIISLSEELIS